MTSGILSHYSTQKKINHISVIIWNKKFLSFSC